MFLPGASDFFNIDPNTAEVTVANNAFERGQLYPLLVKVQFVLPIKGANLKKIMHCFILFHCCELNIVSRQCILSPVERSMHRNTE